MTDFLFDTNAVQILIDPRRSPALVAAVEERVRESGLVISAVTAFELRRGIRVLRLRGEGRRKETNVERLIRSADVLGLDSPAPAPWTTAADLYARGRVMTPAVIVDDADLLIAATALHYSRTLVTTDGRLAKNLEVIGAGPEVVLLPAS